MCSREGQQPGAMAHHRARKRTAAQMAVTYSSNPEAAAGDSSNPKVEEKTPTKRVKAPPKTKNETECFPEKRNMEDLWLSAFPVGTEWENIDKIKEFNWNFENLDKTLDEGGELYEKTVYLFGSTEPQQSTVNGEVKMVYVHVIVVVDCPFPSSDKTGINSVQRENEEIVPMKAIKMAWVPYVPVVDRLSRIDSLKTKIFTLCCTQRRST
ncbi:hypothetical protein BS78_04G286000 [Paspalum vaginatum]|nr:hypothetical protein BS78_04G286000 [Paspalum vaginatum]KAJ1281147.1 hypothetical protein BS78_04G286000 [Paspalum vaginatum]KAJ1281148.1 hypothetical protein BS78_04G286000 [Paspalum vaginatum]KAJ1281149.1 hypothetical protein BS78_04G286000 [Paspalum vaginatum]KAJ1281150.1 hypothetical protein BS78_04G286000 [Paspalum vaginatum]